MERTIELASRVQELLLLMDPWLHRMEFDVGGNERRDGGARFVVIFDAFLSQWPFEFSSTLLLLFIFFINIISIHRLPSCEFYYYRE
jgi:hypothetical protein